MEVEEEKDTQVVIVIDTDDKQKEKIEPVETVTQVVTRPRSDSELMARRAIQTVLGTDNDYLQRLLTSRLEGREKKYKRIQLSKLVNSDRSELRSTLLQAINSSQKNAIDALSEAYLEAHDNLDMEVKIDKNQAISSWVLNTVLHEKLKDRETRESADYWKYINGVLALVLPVATGLIEYFLTKYLSRDDCPCST